MYFSCTGQFWTIFLPVFILIHIVHLRLYHWTGLYDILFIEQGENVFFFLVLTAFSDLLSDKNRDKNL